MFGLLRLYYGSIQHLTICTKGVACFRKQTIGLGDPILGIGQNLTGRTCIVVCTVNQHQAAVGLNIVNVPPQLAALFNNTILNIRLFGNNRSVRLFGLLRLYYGSIQHLTVRTKGVACFGQQIIGLGNPVLAIYNKVTCCTNIIVSTVDQNQTCINRLAVFNVEHTFLSRNDTAYSEHIVKELTVCCKGVNSVTFFCIVTVNSDCANASVHVEIFTEIILITCESYPATLNESRTYTVTSAVAIGSECTHGCAVFVKGVSNTTNGCGCVSVQLIIVACITIHCEGCAAVDVVIAFVCTHILPALNELAVYSVVEIISCRNYAGAKCGSITASCTNKCCVNNCIVVTGCFNNSTKVYDGLTCCTVSSACVTVFGTSSNLICKSNKLCIVNVVGRGNCCEFGSNVNGATERVAVNNTVNNINIDVYNRLVTHICRIQRLFSNIIISIISPNANRNAYKSVIESLTTYTVSFNGYGENLRNFVVFQCSLEAVSNNSTLGYPSVSVIKLKLCNQLVYVCEIRNVDVNIVDGLCLGSFAGIVVTTKLNYCITCNSESAGDLHGVTKLVLNLKCNGMNTCTESNVALSGEHIAVDRRFYNNTINGDLTGGKVKSCVICNGCG